MHVGPIWLLSLAAAYSPRIGDLPSLTQCSEDKSGVFTCWELCHGLGILTVLDFAGWKSTDVGFTTGVRAGSVGASLPRV